MSRSFLFVPGDSDGKLAKASSSNADALIVDLEDSVSVDEKPRARIIASEFLRDKPRAKCWVRINPLNSSFALSDLKAVIPVAPHGIVLPKPERARDVSKLDKLLAVLEQEHGIDEGTTRILPIATETPGSVFHLHEYTGCSERLAGLSWGAEDLSTAIGATANRDADGHWLPQFELVRSLCLFAAAAAEVPAVDTVYTDFRDEQGLAEYAGNARRDGFSGMLAIHPSQVGLINEAFSPTQEELSRAQKIVELFEKNPGMGVIGLDGEMIDRPHLLQAKKILAMAASNKQGE